MGKKKAVKATEVSELDSLKSMTMDELVAKYNSMVPEDAAKTEVQLGSLIKARNAIKKLMGVSLTAPRSGRVGIGKFAKEQLLEGKTNAEVLEAVKAQFPEAHTTMGCVNYYRAALVRGGQLASKRTAANEDEDEVQEAA